MKNKEIKLNSKTKKCRVHNKELIYCKDCVEVRNTIEIIKVLRLDAEEQNRVYKEALEKLENNK